MIQVSEFIAFNTICPKRSTAVIALRMTRWCSVSRWIEVIVRVNCAEIAISRKKTGMIDAGIALISIGACLASEGTLLA